MQREERLGGKATMAAERQAGGGDAAETDPELIELLAVLGVKEPAQALPLTRSPAWAPPRPIATDHLPPAPWGGPPWPAARPPSEPRWPPADGRPALPSNLRPAHRSHRDEYATYPLSTASPPYTPDMRRDGHPPQASPAPSGNSRPPYLGSPAAVHFQEASFPHALAQSARAPPPPVWRPGAPPTVHVGRPPADWVAPVPPPPTPPPAITPSRPLAELATAPMTHHTPGEKGPAQRVLLKRALPHPVPAHPPPPTVAPALADLGVNGPAFEVPSGSKFFVIKSFTVADVRQAVKLGLWASTEHGNQRLEAAFFTGAPVFLYFSVNGSGLFCGMARMVSRVDRARREGLWTDDRWGGAFRVQWLYLKDVPNREVQHLRVGDKSITRSRDAQEMLFQQGLQMANVFMEYRGGSTLLSPEEEPQTAEAEGTRDETAQGRPTLGPPLRLMTRGGARGLCRVVKVAPHDGTANPLPPSPSDSSGASPPGKASRGGGDRGTREPRSADAAGDPDDGSPFEARCGEVPTPETVPPGTA